MDELKGTVDNLVDELRSAAARMRKRIEDEHREWAEDFNRRNRRDLTIYASLFALIGVASVVAMILFVLHGNWAGLLFLPIAALDGVYAVKSIRTYKELRVDPEIDWGKK